MARNGIDCRHIVAAYLQELPPARLGEKKGNARRLARRARVPAPSAPPPPPPPAPASTPGRRSAADDARPQPRPVPRPPTTRGRRIDLFPVHRRRSPLRRPTPYSALRRRLPHAGRRRPTPSDTTESRRSTRARSPPAAGELDLVIPMCSSSDLIFSLIDF